MTLITIKVPIRVTFIPNSVIISFGKGSLPPTARLDAASPPGHLGITALQPHKYSATCAQVAPIYEPF